MPRGDDLDASERFSTEITPLVYDLQWGNAPDVSFWVEWCKEQGDPVLELGCGNGRPPGSRSGTVCSRAPAFGWKLSGATMTKDPLQQTYQG
jgi:hypothetical protein